MSDAIRIFSHAVSMVFRDPFATLRATYAGVALTAAARVGLAVSGPDVMAMAERVDPAQLPAFENIGLMFVAVVLMLVGYLMIVAAWHRYVLLPDAQRDDGFTPSSGIVLGYLGRCMLLGIILALPATVLLLPATRILATTESTLMAGLFSIPVRIILLWFFLRLSLILPACTIDARLTLWESWSATTPLAMPIAGLAVLMALADFAFNTVIGLLPFAGMASVLVSIPASVVYALISASILTTLYGIAVQGRAI